MFSTPASSGWAKRSTTSIRDLTARPGTPDWRHWPRGASWDKQGTGPVISPDPATWEGGYIAANGSLGHDGDHFLYWYQAGPRGGTSIGLADSADAAQWSKYAKAVLAPGPSRSWDETAVGDPYVVRRQGTYTMYYLGQNRFGIQRLGVARSTDGIHWQKSHANPILDTGPPGSFDERGLGEPAVFCAADRYLMLYTGRDANEDRRIGWAESVNGVDWKKLPTLPLLEGSQAWNLHVVCDPSVWRRGGDLLVWFGGGNRPSPDENLNGRIWPGDFEDQGQRGNKDNFSFAGPETSNRPRHDSAGSTRWKHSELATPGSTPASNEMKPPMALSRKLAVLSLLLAIVHVSGQAQLASRQPKYDPVQWSLAFDPHSARPAGEPSVY